VIAFASIWAKDLLSLLGGAKREGVFMRDECVVQLRDDAGLWLHARLRHRHGTCKTIRYSRTWNVRAVLWLSLSSSSNTA